MENEKVARILAACSDFEREDFVALAMACFDQADVPRWVTVLTEHHLSCAGLLPEEGVGRG